MHYLDYHEQAKHGTDEFPLGFYHVDEHHLRYHMPFHWHMEMEIIRILKGCLQVKLDDEEINSQAGDLILISEGVIHGGLPNDCVYECAVFDLKALLMHTEACKQALRQITKHNVAIRSHFTRKDRAICQAAGHLFQALQKKAPGSELIAVGSLYEILGIICQKGYYVVTADRPPRSSQKMVHLKPVLEYIEISYASPVTLEDLSKIAGMSPKYFCRYFHSIIHRTPMDYLNYYRVERACYLLSTTDCSVTEAAYRCGFNDASYFIRTFRKYKGVTPKQYEKSAG